MRRLAGRTLVVAAVFLGCRAAHAQSNPYSEWANFPQSADFFPIAVFSENPSRSLGSGAPYANDAAAMAGVKINVLLDIDNGGGGNYPTSFGQDTNGLFSMLASQGIYSIVEAAYGNNTGADSVASVEAMAVSGGKSQYLIGYTLGDEPEGGNGCTATVPGIPADLSAVHGYDSTRPFFWNMTDWPFGHGQCGDNSSNAAALKAIDVGSFDQYPLISPWNGSQIPVVAGKPQDSMWIQGWSVAQLIASGRENQPIWAFVDTGDNALGYSSQNGSNCNASTNLCSSDNHEYRATAEQVNAEVWMTLINGAMGIEYFCDDTSVRTGETAYDFCLGSTTSGEASVSAAIASNLTYIDKTILSFAPQLNSPVSGRCTMNTDTRYTSYETSCSDGILTVSTGMSTVPGSAIVKSYNGAQYLFADTDRTGLAKMTFTLSGDAGYTAKVVYDSNAQYDPPHSSVGTAFTVDSSGRFSDTLGADGHDYQPKIYKITAPGAGTGGAGGTSGGGGGTTATGGAGGAAGNGATTGTGGGGGTGTGGAVAEAGSAGTSGRGGASAGAGNGPSATSPAEKGGCSCCLPAPEPSGPAGLLVSGLGLALVLRRRRRGSHSRT
jgi:hypothetical protein